MIAAYRMVITAVSCIICDCGESCIETKTPWLIDPGYGGAANSCTAQLPCERNNTAIISEAGILCRKISRANAGVIAGGDV